jgi:hypothetical protein
MRADLRAIAQAASFDPKAALLERAGPLTDYRIFHNNVLVATYIPSEMIGSIIRPDRNLAESRWQGKVGLVLKCGPLAFKDDSLARFGGITINVGDWVIYRPSDGTELFIKDHKGALNDGLPCRIIEDTLLKGDTADPSLIY